MMTGQPALGFLALWIPPYLPPQRTGGASTPLPPRAKTECCHLPMVGRRKWRTLAANIIQVGIYRSIYRGLLTQWSGSAADVFHYKRAYEFNSGRTEQLQKECDVHSLAGALHPLPKSNSTTQSSKPSPIIIFFPKVLHINRPIFKLMYK